MSVDSVKVRRDGAVGVIQLDRPGSYNALDGDMIRGLFEAVVKIRAMEGIRAVLLTGTGDFFCPGADIKWMTANEGRFSEAVDEVLAYLHAAQSRITRTGLPVVTAVNGIAAGGGLALAMVGDIVLAREDARFVAAYTRIGLNPDGGLTFYLGRLLGVRRALDLVLTNRELNATQAQEWGLVTRVLPKADFAAQAMAVAQELAAGPTLALGRSRDLLYHSWNNGLEAQLERETQHIVAATRTEDMRNGIKAFVEKRKPTFAGR
jgi:2-(1,2-epoxy-1,2-dihydrophenyl)acetyl-CoA isomerase